MLPRIERSAESLKRIGVARRKASSPKHGPPDRDLALTYSNGYVTVEISHDALDAYLESHGDVPLPIVEDAETGDRRTYDAKHKVRAVYDRSAQLREVSTRNRDGLHVRINFIDADADADAEPDAR